MESLLGKIGSIHSTCIVDGEKVLRDILNNCETMLFDRGCKEVEKTENLLETMEQNEPVLRGRNGKNIDVFFYTEERVGVKFLRNVVDNTMIDKTIILSLDGPTTFTKKESEQLPIQFFTFKDLSVNITTHKIVPKHELCDDNLQWSNEELPKLYSWDPIVQYYDFPVGSIIKIYRTIGSGEPQIYYRLICS